MAVGTIGDITTTTRINAQECIVCGVVFGLSAEYEAQRQRDHKAFVCPNGHSQLYNSETEEERLRRILSRERDYTAETRRALAAERRQHAATKGKVTKLRKRAQAGMCAECGRTFQNYARHMETKHPA